MSEPRPWLESDFAIAEIIDHAERFVSALFGAGQTIAKDAIEPPRNAPDFVAAVALVRTRFMPEYRKTIARILASDPGASV